MKEQEDSNARIVPTAAPAAFERLVAEGKITTARPERVPLPPAIRSNGPVSDLINEQRR